MPSPLSRRSYSYSHFLYTYIAHLWRPPRKLSSLRQSPPLLKKSVSLINRLKIPLTMSQIFKRLISYVGKVKLEQLPKEWQKPVDDVLTAAEQAVSFTSSIVPSLRESLI